MDTDMTENTEMKIFEYANKICAVPIAFGSKFLNEINLKWYGRKFLCIINPSSGEIDYQYI